MKISVDLTLLPLHESYEESIKEFIVQLRNSEYTVLENPLSTQIYGEYNSLMLFLNTLIKQTFEQEDHILINMKIVKTDRSDYEPDF